MSQLGIERVSNERERMSQDFSKFGVKRSLLILQVIFGLCSVIADSKLRADRWVQSAKQQKGYRSCEGNLL